MAGKFKFNKKQIVPVLFLILTSTLLLLLINGKILVAVSASVNHRIFYLLSANHHKFTVGDYLVFTENNRLSRFTRESLISVKTLVKQVGCQPGLNLHRDKENNWYCQGRYLGTALRFDSKGDRLPQFNYHGPVPSNRYFVTGSDPRSYDSKYFGFINENEILYHAVPLW